jgi:hypothetical protein
MNNTTAPHTDKGRFNCWDCGRIIEPDELRSIRHEVDPFGQAHDWRICQNCKPIKTPA